jgi:hypothetical protein
MNQYNFEFDYPLGSKPFPLVVHAESFDEAVALAYEAEAELPDEVRPSNPSSLTITGLEVWAPVEATTARFSDSDTPGVPKSTISNTIKQPKLGQLELPVDPAE